MSKSLAVPLSAPYAERLSFQSYAPAPPIEGVWTHPLCKHRSSNGALMEFLRIGPNGIVGLPSSLEPKQVNVSWAAPGRINAFHVHVRYHQDELWTVPHGSLLVWLADMRKGSPTEGIRRKLVLCAEQPALVHIPTGVAHGYRAGHEGAILLYAADAQFDPEDPNEGRIPWDVFGADIWEDDRG
ncbi:MAG: dTDP-4-dehydrorhamnose 3,5-epimerase family protein [Myxococcota bacterium]